MKYSNPPLGPGRGDAPLVDYATPAPAPPRRAWVDVRMLRTCVMFGVVLTGILLAVVPRLENVYMDYSQQLPLGTVLLLKLSHFCSAGGIVVLWALLAAPPFLLPRINSGEEGRRAGRVGRLVVTLLMGVVVTWMAWALFAPYVNLLETAGTASGR
jgi:type II secretory pathway component PulF